MTVAEWNSMTDWEKFMYFSPCFLIIFLGAAMVLLPQALEIKRDICKSLPQSTIPKGRRTLRQKMSYFRLFCVASVRYFGDIFSPLPDPPAWSEAHLNQHPDSDFEQTRKERRHKSRISRRKRIISTVASRMASLQKRRIRRRRLGQTGRG